MPPCALCDNHRARATKRHNLLLGAQCRIAHCAGVAKAVDLAMERLWAGIGTASLERGNMAVLRLGCQDVAVVHPVANSFVQRTAMEQQNLTGCKQKPQVQRSWACGWWVFTSLYRETYGRLGKTAMQFLGTLAASAASSVLAGLDVTPSSLSCPPRA
jgi:hypothetical protein